MFSSNEYEEQLTKYHDCSMSADREAKRGNKEKAIKILSDGFELARKDQRNDYCLFFNADISFYNENFNEAITLLKEAIVWIDDKQLPKDSFLIRNLGVYYCKIKQYDDAIGLFTEALVLNPHDSVAMRLIGTVHLQKNDTDAAIHWFKKALDVDPNDSNTLTQMGIVIAKANKEEESIDWFERALAEDPDSIFALRQKGISLSELGDFDGAIECFDAILVEDTQDSITMREKGVTLTKKHEDEEAIEWFNKALSINPEDYRALRQKGVSLSNMGNEYLAIEFFDRALKIEPSDYDSIRSKGVSFSKQGKLVEAESWLLKALEVNDKDFHSLTQLGIVYSKERDFTKALEYFDKTLEIKPDEYFALQHKASILWNSGEKELAYEVNCQALMNSTKDKFIFNYLTDVMRFLCRELDYDFEEKWYDIFSDTIQPSLKPINRLFELKSFISIIREELKDEYDEWLEEKAKAEEQEKDFVKPITSFNDEASLFLVLRKWNSYTPALPASIDSKQSVGGGYYLRHQSKGIVIDPGYNFLQNFADAGGRIHDIDIVIITHAHDDHTADFEAMCSILNQLNKTSEGSTQQHQHKIRLFLNNGSYLKFSHILNIKYNNYIEHITTLNSGQEHILTSSVKLTVLPAYHDEIIARDQAVGLLFTVDCNSDERKILCTGDTGLFPLPADTELIADARKIPLWECYPDDLIDKLDLLISHIGSIKQSEFKKDIGDSPADACYPNHLGIIGVATLITYFRPTVGLIAEFGEETRSFRKYLVEQLQENVVNKLLEGTGQRTPRVVPGDIPFIYNISLNKFYCIVNKEWVSIADIDFDMQDDTVYYFDRNQRQDLAREHDKFKSCTVDFENIRIEKQGLYFKD